MVDPVTIIESRGVGLDLAVIELVQITGMIAGTTASALARTTALLEERIATERNDRQRRRVLASQIAACAAALGQHGWSLDAQDTRIIITQH